MTASRRPFLPNQLTSQRRPEAGVYHRGEQHAKRESIPFCAPVHRGMGVVIDRDTHPRRTDADGASGVLVTVVSSKTNPDGATANVVSASARAIGFDAHWAHVGLASEITVRRTSPTHVMLAGNWKTLATVGVIAQEFGLSTSRSAGGQ